jgi:hypothetical protein
MSGPLLSEGDLPPWDCTVIHFSSDWDHTDVLLRCSHMIGDGQLFMQLLKDVMLEYADGEGEGDNGSVASDSEAGSVASSAPSSRAGTSGGGSSFTSGSGRAPGSPLLIRAVHQSSAFLPPPSVERAARERELKRQKAAAAAARRKRDGLRGDLAAVWRLLWKCAPRGGGRRGWASRGTAASLQWVVAGGGGRARDARRGLDPMQLRTISPRPNPPHPTPHPPHPPPGTSWRCGAG